LRRATWAIIDTSAGRLAGARRGLKLDQPGLARRLGDRLDLDAGLLREVGIDMLVERVLEVAAVGADLERLLGACMHGGKAGEGCGPDGCCPEEHAAASDARA
jgi:hypothetical protein